MYQVANVDTILDAGIALSKERDRNRLLDMLLDKSMGITGCDGGVLYILKEDTLHFQVVKYLSKNIDFGKNGAKIEVAPVSMEENNICSYSVKRKEVMNIEDVYECTKFDFSALYQYDKESEYRTQSMLMIPLLNQEEEAIGVLQLINALNENQQIIAFDPDFERIILALASQAAIAVSNVGYMEEIKDQMWSFTEAMAEAIDTRTPYNANHVRNVAVYACKIADRINELHEQGLEEEFFDANRREQLKLSALLHDLGKLAIPTKIMNKATRLEDKLGEIETRFELLRLKYKILYLEKKIGQDEFSHHTMQLDQIWELVNQINDSGTLTEEVYERLQNITKLTYCYDGEEIPYFTKEEQEDILIRRGTLTEAERVVMESHVEMTERILSKVHFNKSYSEAPRFAVQHHECLNGTGYPKNLTADQLPLESRILAVADICDALLATDRPYKKPLPREEAFDVLYDMAQKGCIDKKLVSYLEACL